MAYLTRSGIVFVVGALVLSIRCPCGRAQFVPQAPQSGSQPRSSTVTSTQVMAPPSGYAPPAAYPGYYPGYGPVQYNGPVGGYLSGGADVIEAQGDYMKSRVQANQM